jgi:hemerythrin-like metal-binding protein
MSFMSWEAQFSVGLDSIDTQHKKLVEMINELHDARLKGRSNETLAHIFEQLATYTVEHFAYEEKLFDQTGYPASAGHKSEHEALRTKVGELKAQMETQKYPFTMELMDFLREWLQKHIMGSDKAYSAHLKAAGIH